MIVPQVAPHNAAKTPIAQLLSPWFAKQVFIQLNHPCAEISPSEIGVVPVAVSYIISVGN